jgi:RNA polymerase sigma factor (TIGR02999 family)
METRHQVTDLLAAWRRGETDALDRLFPLVYDELRRVASRQLGREATGHTLDTTALVHEAYLRLVDQNRVAWADRAHFFAIAARAMRRVLLDHARRHHANKRGGGVLPSTLDDATPEGSNGDADADSRAATLIALDEALGRLETVDDRLSRVVECRFFGGLTEEETAEALGITARTVRRDWVKAKAWLAQAMGGG